MSQIKSLSDAKTLRQRDLQAKGMRQYIGKPGGTGKPQLAIPHLPVTRFSVVPR